jgi:hypothetical protein
MPWLTDVNLTFINGRNALTNKSPLGYKDAKTKRIIKIRQGFDSDGASIPSAFWPKFKFIGLGHPFDVEHRREGFLHDYLCRCGPSLNPPVKRSLADRIFLRSLLEAGRKPKWKCYEFYFGVRIGAIFGIGKPDPNHPCCKAE